MGGTVHVQRAGETAVVVLDSPGKLNAICEAMWQSLARVFGEKPRADDHESRLEEFRRLDRDAGDRNPAARALHLDADEQDRDHQHQHDAEHDQRHAPDLARVDLRVVPIDRPDHAARQAAALETFWPAFFDAADAQSVSIYPAP